MSIGQQLYTRQTHNGLQTAKATFVKAMYFTGAEDVSLWGHTPETRKNAELVARVHKTPERVGEVITAYRTALYTFTSDTFAAPAQKQAAVEELKPAAYDALAKIRASFEAEYPKALDMLKPVLPGIGTLEAMRVWGRIKAQLEGGVALERVLQSATLPDLRILIEELPAWYSVTISDANAEAVSMKAAEELIWRKAGELDAKLKAEGETYWYAKSKGGYFCSLAITYAFAAMEQPGDSVLLPRWDGTTFTA